MKFTDNEQKQLIQEWRQSGLSQRKFCIGKNLSPTLFCRWIKNERHGQALKTKDFIPIATSSHSLSDERSPVFFELICGPSGVNISLNFNSFFKIFRGAR